MCERVEEPFGEAQWEPVSDGPGAGGGAVSTPRSRAEGLNYWLSPRGEVSPGSRDSWEAVGKEERTLCLHHTLCSGAPREPAASCPARRVIVSG